MGPGLTGPDDLRERLRADCSRCVGLCCVAPAFERSSDFAIDKPAGRACPNLRLDDACGIHSELRERGFAGCTAFDCFGAGQQVSQVSFPGRSWRESPAVAADMFEVFELVQQLHEMLWYLADALSVDVAADLRPALAELYDATELIAHDEPAALRGLDVDAHRRQVGQLLTTVSDRVRSAVGGGTDHRAADLVGADLRAEPLRGVTLRGARLIGADLRGADLEGADLLAADLRGADLRGTRLAGALFVTQFQVNGARGDAATTLPPSLLRPPHWH